MLSRQQSTLSLISETAPTDRPQRRKHSEGVCHEDQKRCPFLRVSRVTAVTLYPILSFRKHFSIALINRLPSPFNPVSRTRHFFSFFLSGSLFSPTQSMPAAPPTAPLSRSFPHNTVGECRISWYRHKVHAIQCLQPTGAVLDLNKKANEKHQQKRGGQK